MDSRLVAIMGRISGNGANKQKSGRACTDNNENNYQVGIHDNGKRHLIVGGGVCVLEAGWEVVMCEYFCMIDMKKRGSFACGSKWKEGCGSGKQDCYFGISFVWDYSRLEAGSGIDVDG